MEILNKNRGHGLLFFGAMMIAMVFSVYSCKETDIDHSKSNINSTMDMVASSQDITLEESKANEEALAVDWTAAADKGSDYIMEYKYQLSLLGGDGTTSTSEFVDDNNFERSYTNKQLQDILVSWGVATDAKCQIQTKVTATFDGPTLVIPEETASVISVRTYGAPQFAADVVYVSGSAVGDDDVEMAANASRFTYTGALSIGSLTFPVDYAGDEKLNAISPKDSDCEVVADVTSDATMLRADAAYSWKITEAKTYRITVDVASKTVSILDAANILEIDSLFLGGSAAAGLENAKIELALEDEAVYAWKGELAAGDFYLPIYFNDMMSMAILPADGGSVELADGQAMPFATGGELTGASNHWTIPAAGTYRVVVNTNTRTVSVYSEANDLANEVVSFNNTVAGINPFEQEVESLWMYGPFNAFANDGSGSQFQQKFKLTQSLANPKVFVYSGEVLPRKIAATSWQATADENGGVVFMVSDIQNNVYAYGSTADAKRNSYAGYVNAQLGVSEGAVAGQSDNRYAFFNIPEGANFVVVNIEEMTVTFDVK